MNEGRLEILGCPATSSSDTISFDTCSSSHSSIHRQQLNVAKQPPSGLRRCCHPHHPFHPPQLIFPLASNTSPTTSPATLLACRLPLFRLCIMTRDTAVTISQRFAWCSVCRRSSDSNWLRHAFSRGHQQRALAFLTTRAQELTALTAAREPQWRWRCSFCESGECVCVWC